MTLRRLLLVFALFGLTVPVSADDVFKLDGAIRKSGL